MSTAGSWTFYDGATGACLGRFAGPRQYLALNTPAGAVVVDGHHCHRSTRLDVASGQLQHVGPDPAEAARAARSDRDRLLAACDWTDTASAPARLGAELYAQWQAYRQALRDITHQPGWPAAVQWPAPPA
jgi:hypothetical protein